MSDIIRVKGNQKLLKVQELSIEESSIAEVLDEDYLQKRLQSEYINGYNEGRESMKTELQDQFNVMLNKKYEELNNFLSYWDGQLEVYKVSFENVVVKTSTVIAEKILRKEIAKDSPIHESLKESLGKIIGANKVLVKINPEDLKLVKEDNRSVQFEDLFPRISFEADERIEKGGCIIETEVGTVDGRIASQLTEIRKSLDLSQNYA